MFARAALVFLFGAAAVLSFQSEGRADVSAPVFKWQDGGCDEGFCQTAWYSSVVAIDLDGDGATEVIAAGYQLNIMNGVDGSSVEDSDPAGGRSWASVAVANLDGAGGLEIVSVHGGGHLNVFDAEGALVWTRQPTSDELRGLALADLDDDGDLEIIVTAAGFTNVNTWVYDADGNLLPGWPQLSGGLGQSHGAFSSGVAAGDIGGSAEGEIVVPSDVIYIAAYDYLGVELPTSEVFTGTVWGAVPTWEDEAFDRQGYGLCSPDTGRAPYRSNFAMGGAVIYDLDGNGDEEIIVTGNAHDCSTGPYTSLYQSLQIFAPDRDRWAAGPWDWHTLPVDMGAPLSEDFAVIELAVPNPAVVDLDGDGIAEIVYPAYDGKMHAFWLDKTEHHSWPYSVYEPAEGFFRFATEPVVVDLDDDGNAEVIFASWTETEAGGEGMLHVVGHDGVLIHQQLLPIPDGEVLGTDALAGPTLAELDGDADLELLLNTKSAGVVAYDLPNSSNARVLWKTSRGNDLRNGQGPLPFCGDSIREANEECDDGNTVDDDSCNNVCVPEPSASLLAACALTTLALLRRRDQGRARTHSRMSQLSYVAGPVAHRLRQ